MKQEKIRFGFTIHTESGPLPKPVALTVSESLHKEKDFRAPLKYMADALTGLSMIRLNPELQCPLNTDGWPVNSCHQAWEHLNPHHELFQRSQQRVQALRKQVKPVKGDLITSFEKTFSETLQQACNPKGMNLTDLWPLVDAITYLESKSSGPLLFNFGLSLSKPFLAKCHSLYALLFHLRALMATDFNSHVEDTPHEALKMDSITDYLPRSEYIVNDALLYHNFRRTIQPFIAGRNSDVKVEKLLIEPMRRHFEVLTHDAVYLIEHLPKDFLEKFRDSDLEEALYLVQMDWLLGSEAGLLFRLREELYGLLNGYEKIFWHEWDGRRLQKAVKLSLHFELSEEDWANSKAA